MRSFMLFARGKEGYGKCDRVSITFIWTQGLRVWLAASDRGLCGLILLDSADSGFDFSFFIESFE